MKIVELLRLLIFLVQLKQVSGTRGISGCNIDGEGVGATRYGKHIVERCEILDDEKRIVVRDGNARYPEMILPFEDCHSTMTVNPDGDNSEVFVYARW